MYNETFIEFIAGVILLFVLGLIVVGIDKTTCYKTAKKLNYQCEYSVWTGCVVIKSNDEKALLKQLRDFN